MIRDAERVTAAEAHDNGILDAVVDDIEDLLPAALALIDELTKSPRRTPGAPVQIPAAATASGVVRGKPVSREVIAIIDRAVQDAARASLVARGARNRLSRFGDCACTAAAREGVIASVSVVHRIFHKRVDEEAAMNFSCMIWPYSGTTVDPVIRLAQTAETCGFESVYVGDSQMIWNDVWVTLGALATATKRVMLGTGVTNTVTRHPAVTANAAMTLNMLSNGRAKLGLGAGDSAVRTAGLSPARIPQLRERLTFMRALLNGQEVDALRPPKKQSGKRGDV
jgi:hypothetical protein